MSSAVSDPAFIRATLEDYAKGYHRINVAAVDGGSGVPEAMFAGDVSNDGWVSWKMLASTLSEDDIDDLEGDFAIKLPPLFRAYVLGGFQLLEHVHSKKHNQPVFNTVVPADRPLKPLRDLFLAWRPLLFAGYAPIAQWGDGWGPMCLDLENRLPDDDCAVVWMDHEALIPMGTEQCRDREAVQPHVKPLYDSYREFFTDVFSHH